MTTAFAVLDNTGRRVAAIVLAAVLVATAVVLSIHLTAGSATPADTSYHGMRPGLPGTTSCQAAVQPRPC